MIKQVSAFAKDTSSIGNIVTRVITNEVDKMERKDVCNDSLKRSEKVKTLPTKTSVTFGSKGEATFCLTYYFKGYFFWQKVVILTLTVVKDMNCEYIPQCCLNQKFKCNK